MGFRIDTVRQVAVEDEQHWEIGFKGVEGRGEYATYYSGANGYGLFVSELRPDGLAWLPVVNSERFYAPPDMSQKDVWSLAATWMKLQGWGPELDQHHREIRRETVQLVECDDESGDMMLEFTPALLQLLGWEAGQVLDLQVVNGGSVRNFVC